MCLSVCSMDMGRASANSAIRCQKTTLAQRSAFAETTSSSVHQKLLQLLNGEMSWKENSSLPRLWPYQWMKHTVTQSDEFIARYW